MSTRCQIRIFSSKDEYADLYHHCDGYFEGVGQELHEALMKESTNANKFMFSLWSKDSSYELTDVNHGDIEYYYELNFKDGTFYGWHVKNWDKINNKYINEIWNGNECIVDKDETMNLLTGEISKGNLKERYSIEIMRGFYLKNVNKLDMMFALTPDSAEKFATLNPIVQTILISAMKAAAKELLTKLVSKYFKKDESMLALFQTLIDKAVDLMSTTFKKEEIKEDSSVLTNGNEVVMKTNKWSNLIENYDDINDLMEDIKKDYN